MTASMHEPDLERARRAAGLSPTNLWLRYFALGGHRTPVELELLVRGEVMPSNHDCSLVAQAIDEHLVEQAGGNSIPY